MDVVSTALGLKDEEAMFRQHVGSSYSKNGYNHPYLILAGRP